MIKPGFYRLHARRVDPRRQGARAKERLFEGSLQQAKLERAKLVQELLDQTEVPTVEAQTFKSYSRSWLKLPSATPAKVSVVPLVTPQAGLLSLRTSW